MVRVRVNVFVIWVVKSRGLGWVCWLIDILMLVLIFDDWVEMLGVFVIGDCCWYI